MKPIYIKMSAFGSYAGVELVDFTDVNHGIFLITGDTGAGKTTIFDAITYALYDETSGGKRDGEMMRSQYADEDTRTYVELEFIYNGEIYKVTRYPRQNRISKRKNKDGDYTMTVDQPSVELIMADGLPFRGKIKETNQKIVDIIGLDRNQFTQIAMIAQGDFLKLLHAPSKERKEIFSKIFNTKIYWRIEEELKTRAKAMYIQLEDNKKDVIREMDNVQTIPGSSYEIEWKEMPRFRETESDKLLDFVKLIIKEAKMKEEELNLTIKTKQKELDYINTSIQQAEDTNKLFDTMDKLDKTKKDLDALKEEMERIKARIDHAKKASVIEAKEEIYLSKKKEYLACEMRLAEITLWLDSNQGMLQQYKNQLEEAELEFRKKQPELSAKVITIKDVLPKYEQYEAKYALKENILSKLTTAKSQLNQLISRIDQTKLQQMKLVQEQEELKQSSEQLIQLTQSVEKLTQHQLALEGICKSVQLVRKLRISYKTAEDVHKSALTEYEEKSHAYELHYHSFIEGQAGILASTLTEGSPCPVCGSTLHPLIADITQSSVSQEALERSKNAMEEANRFVKARYDEYQRAKQKYEGEKQLCEYEGKRAYDATFDVDTFSYDELLNTVKECTEHLKDEISNKMKALSAKEKFDQNEKKSKELQSVLEDYLLQKDRGDIEVKELEIAYTETETTLAALKESLLYRSKQEALAEIAATNNQITRMDEYLQDISKKYQILFNDTTERQGKLKSENDTLIRLAAEQENAKEAFVKELANQGFAEETAYQSAKIGRQEIEKLAASYEAYRDEVLKNRANLKSYSEQVVGKSRVNTEEMLLNRKTLQSLKIMLEEESKSIYGIRTRNESIKNQVIKLQERRKTLLESYGNLSRLESTANGRLSQCHMNFQTYIQRKYFNYVIREANKRLYVMSNNQFILQCRDVKDLAGQGEVGLDLDVYSMINNQTRDVKTLSGGESFIAALAMALGMADIIQNSAGSIHIDTMFIDEGFGSLSDDTRMQAIRILSELSQGKRLVGIISHVSELKAQIGTKLMVTKTEKGSRVKWEKGD